MLTYNETRGIRLKNKSIRDYKNNEIKYKYIHKIYNMQKYIISADIQYNTNSKYSRYDSFLSVADCVWARDVSYVTLRENLFCITKRAVHITCRRNVVWFQLCDLTDSNSKIKPKKKKTRRVTAALWRRGTDKLWDFFAWRRVVQLHKVNLWAGSFRLKRGSLEKQAGSKTKSTQMRMNRWPTCLFGRARSGEWNVRGKMLSDIFYCGQSLLSFHAKWDDGRKINRITLPGLIRHLAGRAMIEGSHFQIEGA